MESPQKQSIFRRPLFSYLVLALIAGTVILLDQWSQDWVRNNLAFGESWVPWPSTLPFLRILNWRNTGAAFGLFQEGGLIFAVLAIIVAILIVYYFPRIQHGDWPLRLAMGLQLGGAVGNLIDRLQHGYVTDFIAVGNFPVFNVADSSITLGVVVLLLSLWLGGDGEQTETTPAKEHVASD